MRGGVYESRGGTSVETSDSKLQTSILQSLNSVFLIFDFRLNSDFLSIKVPPAVMFGTFWIVVQSDAELNLLFN